MEEEMVDDTFGVNGVFFRGVVFLVRVSEFVALLALTAPSIVSSIIIV